jgi:hypothetical protein
MADAADSFLVARNPDPDSDLVKSSWVLRSTTAMSRSPSRTT